MGDAGARGRAAHHPGHRDRRLPDRRRVARRDAAGSANTDERAWERADEVDFDREVEKHIAFGGGVHRCLGSHLARMELRVALEEWHPAVPDYRLADGMVLRYSRACGRSSNLELVW